MERSGKVTEESKITKMAKIFPLGSKQLTVTFDLHRFKTHKNRQKSNGVVASVVVILLAPPG